MEEPKNHNGQKGYGSPAQIWAELDLLARRILGSDKSGAEYAARFEEINTAVSSAVVQELPGFKSPTAECETFLNTAHRTPHTAQ